MINDIRRLFRRFQKIVHYASRRHPDFVNFDDFTDVVAMHRARGVRIGYKVRLLGHIDSVNPHLVSVGDYVVLGAHSALLTHCPIKGAQPVSIGAYTYVAFGALILPGVSVGQYCVVGAGAVVTRSVSNESIVAGNPARVLRKLTGDEKARLIEIMHTGQYFGRDSKIDNLPMKIGSAENVG
jgi:acetyltransferase-like isoleucine patch superfamily enzyme